MSNPLTIKKDGTLYLALIQHPDRLTLEGKKSGLITWNIMRWGYPAMISGAKNTWVDGSGLGIKVKKILEIYELSEVLNKIQDNQKVQYVG